ncbi:ankyrin [Piromyces finnis]|uniref:Ankyrin n=1 Tax=Piromyces finnis TaxID=1754191 RepID=A0A1Y1VLW3_9FUNG|nr:ankyrin [Piromyces finnis]|eukprot:ORX59924.1 ankyrin [Piromyces finnis]
MDKSKSKSIVAHYTHSYIPVRSGKIVKRKLTTPPSISATRVQKHFQIFFQDQLLNACEKGNIIEVKRLLERYRISPNFKDSKGRTPLHFACSSGNEKIAELIIHAGANVNAIDLNQNTPLHLSVISNNYTCVALLLKAGANAHARDKSYKTPLDLALSRIQYIIQNLNTLDNASTLIPEIQEVIKLLKYYIQIPRNLVRSQSDSFSMIKFSKNIYPNLSYSNLTKLPTSPTPSLIDGNADISPIKLQNINIIDDIYKNNTMKVTTTISPESSSSSTSSSSKMIINSPIITNEKLLQNQTIQQSFTPKNEIPENSKVDDLEEICFRLSQLNNDLTNDHLPEPLTNTNLEELRSLLNNIKI